MAPDARQTLGEICADDIQTGPFGSQLHADEYQDEGIAVLMPKDINNGQADVSSAARIAPTRATDLERHRLKIGDILFSRRGDVARSALITKDSAGSICGTGCLRARPSDQHNPQYLAYQLQTHKVRRWLERNAVGQTMPNLNTEILSKLPLVVGSSKPEEDKAVEVLSTWDQAIETMERLIENNNCYRTALLQQLIWGKTRFGEFVHSKDFRLTKYGRIPNDWRFPSIGEIAHEVSDRNAEARDLPVLACSKHVGFVNSLEYFKKKVYSDDTTNYKVVPRGTFGFPANHIEEGSIGYQDICNAGLVSPIYCLFRTDESVCDGYLYRLLKTDHYRQIFSAATNSSVDRRGSLRWRDFSALNIPLPSLDEQRAISRVIDLADESLDNITKQLSNLRAQRTALMQALLTGQRRIRVDDAVETAYA